MSLHVQHVRTRRLRVYFSACGWTAAFKPPNILLPGSGGQFPPLPRGVGDTPRDPSSLVFRGPHSGPINPREGRAGACRCYSGQARSGLSNITMRSGTHLCMSPLHTHFMASWVHHESRNEVLEQGIQGFPQEVQVNTQRSVKTG